MIIGYVLWALLEDTGALTGSFGTHGMSANESAAGSGPSVQNDWFYFPPGAAARASVACGIRGNPGILFMTGISLPESGHSGRQ